MKPKLHTYEIIKSAVLQVKSLTRERSFPLHAVLTSEWGVGKTVASLQVEEEFPDVFYLKFPNHSVDHSNLIKIVLLSMGVGPTRGYFQNYELLTRVMTARGLINPVLLIDEAQYLFSKPTALSFFKDLSEDPKVGFSYVFVADSSAQNVLEAEGHSLIKRIKVRMNIPPLTEKTVYKLAEYHGITLNGKAYEVALSTRATTMDVDYALFLARKAGKKELSDKEFKSFLFAAKRGE